MSIEHKGFDFECDVYCGNEGIRKFHSDAKTERTAIKHARAENWFIGHIRITAGARKSTVRTVRRVLGPCCKWMVGL